LPVWIRPGVVHASKGSILPATRLLQRSKFQAEMVLIGDKLRMGVNTMATDPVLGQAIFFGTVRCAYLACRMPPTIARHQISSAGTGFDQALGFGD